MNDASVVAWLLRLVSLGSTFRDDAIGKEARQHRFRTQGPVGQNDRRPLATAAFTHFKTAPMEYEYLIAMALWPILSYFAWGIVRCAVMGHSFQRVRRTRTIEVGLNGETTEHAAGTLEVLGACEYCSRPNPHLPRQC